MDNSRTLNSKGHHMQSLPNLANTPHNKNEINSDSNFKSIDYQRHPMTVYSNLGSVRSTSQISNFRNNEYFGEAIFKVRRQK